MAAALAFCLPTAGTAQAPDTALAPIDPAMLETTVFAAEITAGAPADPGFRKLVLLGRNTKGEPVITGIALLAPGQAANPPDGTEAILVVEAKGPCAAPHGPDAADAGRVITFVSDAKGKHVWVVAQGPEGPRIALVSGGGGPWEAFKTDPKAYKTYRCAKYH